MPSGGGGQSNDSSPDKNEWSNWTTSDRAQVGASLSSADPEIVEAAFRRIAANFPAASWLPDVHGVADDPWNTARTSLPFDPPLDQDVADYVAASVPVHLADAWTYFGQAMHAVASGAVDVAQHLLYYSELRAMNALLFRHGVLLMGERNFVLTPSGVEKIPFPKGAGRIERNSHQGIWVLFTEWASSPRGAGFCGDVVNFAGQTLGTWATERPKPVELTGAMGALLKEWGVDIQRFSSDRAVRNNSSYTPTRLRPSPTTVSPAYVSDLLDQVWRLVAPTDGVAFQQLDPFIARIAFDSFTQAEHDDSAAAEDADAVSDPSATLPGEQSDGDGDGDGDETRITGSYVPGDQTPTEFWVERVLGRSPGQFVTEFIDDQTAHPTPTVIEDASLNLAGTSAGRIFNGMVGRALILLRFATGATRDLIATAGYSTVDVDFWIRDMLQLHGIRIPDSQDYRDLWFDIEDAVAELEDMRSESDADDANLSVLIDERAKQVQILAGFERVPAWAAAPVAGDDEERVA